jgi:hypothetical protein
MPIYLTRIRGENPAINSLAVATACSRFFTLPSREDRRNALRSWVRIVMPVGDIAWPRVACGRSRLDGAWPKVVYAIWGRLWVADHPRLGAERAAALDTQAHGLGFHFRLRRAHMVGPIWPSGQRPSSEQFLVLSGPAHPTVKTAPSPLLSAGHQIRAEGISLDVTGDRVEMVVLLDGK